MKIFVLTGLEKKIAVLARMWEKAQTHTEFGLQITLLLEGAHPHSC